MRMPWKYEPWDYDLLSFLRKLGWLMLGVAAIMLALRLSRGMKSGDGKVNAELSSEVVQDSHTESEGQARRLDAALVEKRDRSIEGFNGTPDERLAIITKASYQVQAMLLKEEVSRTSLIDLQKEEEVARYTFSIERRKDFDEFLNETISNVAKEVGVNRLALKAACEDKVRIFHIPEGSYRQLMIKVSTDTEAEISYTNMLKRIGAREMDLDLRSLMTGTVQSREEGWRYEDLLERESE